MREVFVDTMYFVAVLSPRDQWSEVARAAETELGRAALVTTESVLIEVLNFFASGHRDFRLSAVKLTRRILASPGIRVLPCRNNDFSAALTLYESRLDKGYSLTDCISMNVMREMGISEVLTHDRHFAQEGFIVLMES